MVGEKGDIISKSRKKKKKKKGLSWKKRMETQKEF